MNSEGKKVIIGIDGVPFQMMKELADMGVMENFARLRGEGSFERMQSSIPDVSSTSWSSIITGENPGEHGVYGFSDVIEGTYSLYFHNFDSLKKPAFWQNNDGKFVILNVPSTYPAKELNGVHISGFVSPDFEEAIYPKSLVDKMKELEYEIDVDSEKAHKSKRLFLEKLFQTLESRKRAYRYLWKNYDWDTFKLVFTGSDRLEHFLWNAWEDEDHGYRDKFLQFFREVDEILGEIEGKLNEEDSLMILSDHGMEGVERNVNLNNFLERGGFLELSEEGERYNRVKEGSKAFALEHGRIYLNKKGKYPRGSVKREEEEAVLKEIIGKLKNLKRDGKEVIKEVYRKEELYEGEQLEEAPDLVVVPESGYNLRGKVEGDLFEESPLQGMHNQNAFLYVKGKIEKNMPESRQPHVEDVVPILNG